MVQTDSDKLKLQEGEPHPVLAAESRRLWGSGSHVGKVRTENQDTYFVDPEIDLFIVSDGMGGHRGGAIASKIITEDLPVMIENKLHKLKKGCPATIRKLLFNSISEQNRHMAMEAESGDGYRGMGATLVTALIRKNRLFLANAGDSRAYLLRNKTLRQLTKDHSVVSELIEQGKIQPHEAEDHPDQGQLVQHMGMEEEVVPYVRSISLKKNDQILLCTDGLTDMLPEPTITEILLQFDDPQQGCNTLILKANQAGGYDNITVILIRI